MKRSRRSRRWSSAIVPVRFVNVGDFSFDVEIFVYVTTAVWEEYLAIQEALC